jgi:hypothetical protein
MVVMVVHDLPPDGWFVALVGITRTAHRRGESVQLSLDAMAFGVCVRTQFGFGEWCRILTTMALAHPFLLSESGVELPRYRRTVLLTPTKSRKLCCGEVTM